MPYETGADGRLYVWVDNGETQDYPTGEQGNQAADQDTKVSPDPRNELVEELRDRVRYLEEESRRKDHLLAAALERIPAIEAPHAPESASEGEGRGGVPPEQQESTERRSWWQRWIGG
jgi:hypothetical protein